MRKKKLYLLRVYGATHLDLGLLLLELVEADVRRNSCCLMEFGVFLHLGLFFREEDEEDYLVAIVFYFVMKDVFINNL